jgi:hypothetical protein
MQAMQANLIGFVRVAASAVIAAAILAAAAASP